MEFSPADYAAFQRIQARIYRIEAWNEKQLRERLAHDPIAYFMRSLVCRKCGCPVTQCECRDEDIPFCDAREVGE